MNYQGLKIIGREIVEMVSDASPEHEQHIYSIFLAVEKLFREGFQQMMEDYKDGVGEALTVEFETYLNGEKINQDDIARGVARALQKAIDGSRQRIKVSI